jgi:hypothetical protein
MPNAAYKMDNERVEAMLCDCGLNTKNSRILFQHLNQFFGRRFFESEKRRRQHFHGQDFPPTVNKIQLEDKTIIHCWYKDPANASVSHSKDDINILKRTVLTPIGEGLRRIVKGGHLSARVFEKDLIVNFSSGTEDSICSDKSRVLVVGDLKFYAQILT